jgi:hypothetical protein
MLQYWSAGYYFFILRDTILYFPLNILPTLEHKLLVMWERIGEELKMVYSAYQFAETWN